MNIDLSNTAKPPILRQDAIALLAPDLPVLAADARGGVEQVARVDASLDLQQAGVHLAAGTVEVVLPVRLHGARLVEVGAAAGAGRRNFAPGSHNLLVELARERPDGGWAHVC